jgi:hypothetical protein
MQGRTAVRPLQLLRIQSMDKPKHKPEHMLMQAIGFSEEDLEANREGHITKRQRVRLNAKRTSWGLRSALAVGIMLFLCASAIIDGNRIGDTVESRVAIIALICIIGGTAIIYTRLRGGYFNSDLRKGDVHIIEDRVVLDVSSQGNRGDSYSVRIDETTFAVNKPIFLAFKNGDPYRIYYAPHSKTILSAEWLRDDG